MAVPLSSASVRVPTVRTRAPWLTKAEFAYEELRTQILTGALAPNTVLSADVLGPALGLSATPIREAIRRLAADNLLVLSAHKDARVKPLTSAELTGLWETRRILNSAALNLACLNTPEEYLALPREVLQAQETTEEVLARLANNRQFHRAMYSHCGNEVLVEMLDLLWDRSDRYRILLGESDESWHAADQQHIEMAEAFATRDCAELQRLSAEHADGTLERQLSRLPR